MAKCRQCGATFGCGCQLIDGLCAYCHGLLKGTKKIKNVITQTYRLRKLC